jgi:hypothetical protein
MKTRFNRVVPRRANEPAFARQVAAGDSFSDEKAMHRYLWRAEEAHGDA